MNVAVVRWRSRDAAEDLLELVVGAAAGGMVQIDPDLARATAVTAHGEGLTAYDAAYLAVARSRAWGLVSCDLRDLVGPGHAITPDDALAAGA